MSISALLSPSPPHIILKPMANPREPPTPSSKCFAYLFAPTPWSGTLSFHSWSSLATTPSHPPLVSPPSSSIMVGGGGERRTRKVWLPAVSALSVPGSWKMLAFSPSKHFNFTLPHCTSGDWQTYPGAKGRCCLWLIEPLCGGKGGVVDHAAIKSFVHA